MERSIGDTADEISSSSASSSESLKLPHVELNRIASKPIVFSWRPPDFPEDSLDNASSQCMLFDSPLAASDQSKVITQEPTVPPDTWLLGGTLGNRHATLVFKSSALANCTQKSIQEKPGHKLHITYKVLQAETKLLSKLLECHGIVEVPPNSSDFNLLWTGSHPKPGALRSLAPHQRVNHFPRSYELTRKDRLYKNIERMQHCKGYKHFDFIPQTFVMPTEFGELCSTHHRIKGPWIVKPVASSRGRGIFIVETPNQVPLEEPVVVAKYISRPLLVAGHKCDLRLYVAVTSFDPLLIYIYEEGLVRFATVKYDSSHKQLWNPCMHLCNYSINKYHSDYVKSDDPSAENVGHKWTLSALLRHLKAEGKNTAILMSQVEDLVIKAILASANSIISACKMFVPNPNNCFELYGFDILIDANLKPWLLEVNLSPSLGCDSPLDVRLKSAMLSDLLTLVGIPGVDPILRPTTNSLTSASIKSSSRVKLGHCRRVHSADGLSSTLPRKNSSMHGDRLSSSALTLTPEETRVIKLAKCQFERRGGFVRIFPAVDSWTKYSQYLDPATGIPISGNNNSYTSYNLSGAHNYNLLLYTHFFPDAPVNTKLMDKSNLRYSSLDRKRDLSLDSHTGSSLARQDRYERQLSQGHRQSLAPQKIHKEGRSIELRKQVMDMLRSGKKMTQSETRKTFSHYLGCVLRRISAGPDQEDHMEIVLKFLQKASSYLRTPYQVKTPSQSLDYKDRAAVVAKQLNDFLYLYNRETELFVDKTEKPSQIPAKLYGEFLENARECDLEEILVHQTTQTVPTHGGRTGFQGVLKCIPNVPKSCGLKPPYKTSTKSKGVKVASLS
ncbi:tubulin polyglutamylase TTLL5 isoform X1 [Tribolium madens]|uniref:tubulin polyglutamylase TTLL5 isoform X1 n=1 Tax=Tribolium madens TaxID=41895 RepID=UPI001CF75F34|nr:tubulin polyglutamylase TTLL5 isoform X1 [Tribolium madens]XP_044265766.1 tubulin polyglutamylase TTLL5 isoform X1 [Tribolium madens]XP_044265767.1 tubulin polyglutamylase TTLL5 isoform X1 [Tribolium madens]XP_044265768.1 tubulin polyglutamylase TTLL5 isoform X1 [Tribolium madens]XP_044265769.1 tubulin polyglutamylase TTLL5 isoform X1 [Tribolium madens]